MEVQWYDTPAANSLTSLIFSDVGATSADQRLRIKFVFCSSLVQSRMDEKKNSKIKRRGRKVKNVVK